MDILNNENLKDLSHDLIIDGSQSYYNKIPKENRFPVVVDYPFPVEAPSKIIDSSLLREFYKYSTTDKETKYVKREFKRMKTNISNQNFENYAALPEFFIDYIKNKDSMGVNYGFNSSYCHGTLEQFNNNGEKCLMRPNKDNNIEICNLTRPKEKKVITPWVYPDRIRSIENMNLDHSNGFTIRSQNNVFVIDIEEDFQINVHLKLKCDSGYYEDSVNHFNGNELALMDSNLKLKLFDLKKQNIFYSYDMKEPYFNEFPKFVKMNFLTTNTLMIMTDKHVHILDIRCKDVPRAIGVKLKDCDMLLDFTIDKTRGQLSNQVFLSSKHAFFIYDTRSAFVDDYIHHNLRYPPCFIKHFQRKSTEIVTLFSQNPTEAVIFGKSSSYSLPHHIYNLEESLEQCKARKCLPVIPNVEKRLNYPITGVQIVPNYNDEDISIYFSNIYGEIFRQDVVQNGICSDQSFDRMYDWLMDIYDNDNPELNMVHMASARAAFQSDIEFNDVDLFKHYEKSHVHKFLEDDEFDHAKWNVEDFDQIWEDDNRMDYVSLLNSGTEDTKVEDWIMQNFGSMKAEDWQ